MFPQIVFKGLIQMDLFQATQLNTNDLANHEDIEVVEFDEKEEVKEHFKTMPPEIAVVSNKVTYSYKKFLRAC